MTETEPTAEQTPEPEAAEPPEEELTGASGVGALLKASRLRCGEDLRDVAHSLKIRYAFLDAIEAGRFADLPGPAYAAGFVRSYADYLGLDSEEVVRRFKKEAVPAPQHRSHLDFPSPVSESGMPKAAIVFVGLLIAVAGYGGWYVTSGKGNLLKELVAPVPEEMAQPAEPPAQETAAAPEATAPAIASGDGKLFQAAPALEAKPATEATPVPAVSEPVPAQALQPTPIQTEAPKPVEPVATPAPAPAPAAQPEKPADAKDKTAKEAKAKAEQEAKDKAAREKAEAEAKAKAEQEAKDKAAKEKAEAEAKAKAEAAAAPAQPATEATPAANRVFGAPEAEVARVVIKATSDSWVQIRDEAKNQTIATRVLRAGDTYRVPTQAGLKLATGNAGALEIRVDGEKVPAVGSPGMVRRGIVLDPDRLKSGTAVDSTGN